MQRQSEFSLWTLLSEETEKKTIAFRSTDLCETDFEFLGLFRGKLGIRITDRDVGSD